MALAVWIPVALLVLLGSRWLVDLVILPDARLHDEIARDRNWGVALIEGAAAIGIALTSSEKRGRAKAGLILNAIVIVVAAIRLSIGGGII